MTVAVDGAGSCVASQRWGLSAAPADKPRASQVRMCVCLRTCVCTCECVEENHVERTEDNGPGRVTHSVSSAGCWRPGGAPNPRS